MFSSLIPRAARRDPTVLVTVEALRDMTQEVLERANIETAWGLAGFNIDDTTVIVTNVVRPDPDEIVRQVARTSLGGELQVEALRWLAANEQAVRQHAAIQSDAKYGFLFKGHSHHKLGYEQFSATDTASIIEAVEKDGMTVAIGPLANIEKNDFRPTLMRVGGPGLRVEIQHEVEFRFYFFSKKMLDAGVRTPVLVQPTLIDAKDVFMPVPALGWQFTRRSEFLEQLRHLTAYGCKVNVAYRDVNATPPLEVQLVVTNPGWKGTLNIVTAADYPRTAPTFQVLGAQGHSRVAGKWIAFPDKQDGELWYPGEDLLEAVFRMEARGLL